MNGTHTSTARWAEWHLKGGPEKRNLEVEMFGCPRRLRWAGRIMSLAQAGRIKEAAKLSRIYRRTILC